MGSTSWVGTTTDATLGSNWSNGVPDITTNDVYIGSSVTTSLVGFGAKRSKQTLTASTNFIADDTVTLDVKTYTYKASPSADGEVDVGTDLETSLANLLAAINLSGTGGEYGASMTVHPTVTAISSNATTLVVAAKDATAAGDSIASTVGGGNTGDGAWGAAALAGYAASTATMNSVWVDGFLGDINSSGSEAAISFDKFYHGGSGTVYIDVQSANWFTVNSPNTALAAHLILTGDVTLGIVCVGGRTTINWNGLTGSATTVWVDDGIGLSETLSITGAGTIPEIIVSRGSLTTNGQTITEYTVQGGQATHQSGAITTLRTGGYFRLNSTDTVTKAYIMAGTLDLLNTVSAKTITRAYLSPSGQLLRRDDVDVFTYPIYKIGVQ